MVGIEHKLVNLSLLMACTAWRTVVMFQSPVAFFMLLRHAVTILIMEYASCTATHEVVFRIICSPHYTLPHVSLLYVEQCRHLERLQWQLMIMPEMCISIAFIWPELGDCFVTLLVSAMPSTWHSATTIFKFSIFALMSTAADLPLLSYWKNAYLCMGW